MPPEKITENLHFLLFTYLHFQHGYSIISYEMEKEKRIKEVKEMALVKVVKSGDSEWEVEEIVELEQFVRAVKAILENGGEMPIAILQP